MKVLLLLLILLFPLSRGLFFDADTRVNRGADTCVNRGADTTNFIGADTIVAIADNSTPHVEIVGTVWLYDERGEKIFLLPESYYARINNLDEVYYYVTFNGVSGKVKKNEVRALGYEFQATGTTADLTINGDFSDFYGLQLKKHPDTQSDSLLTIPLSAPFTFVGKYPTDSGETWYYVKYENVMGYVKASRTSAPTLEIPTFTPEVATPPAPGDSQEEVKSELKESLSTELKIIIIVGLAVPAIAIVVLIFTKKRN